MGKFRDGYNVASGILGGLIKNAAPGSDDGVDGMREYFGDNWADLHDCNEYDYMYTYLNDDFSARRIIPNMDEAYDFCLEHNLDYTCATIAAIIYSKPELFGIDGSCFVAYGMSAVSFADDREYFVESFFALDSNTGHQCENVTFKHLGMNLECVSDFNHDLYADVEQVMLNIDEKPFDAEVELERACSLYELYDYMDNQARCGVPRFENSINSSLADSGGSMKTLAITMMETFSSLPAQLHKECPRYIVYKLEDKNGSTVDCLIGFSLDTHVAEFIDITGLIVYYVFDGWNVNGSRGIQTGHR